MFETTLPSDNLKKKSRAIQDVANKSHSVLPFKVHLEIHQIPFCFYFDDEVVVRELFDTYPLAWFREGGEGAISVFWHNTRDCGFSDEEWEAEPSFECYVNREKGVETAVHRDFAATFDGRTCLLLCPYHIQDGFFNFLRWIAPLKFLEQKKLLLHSSCVIDHDRHAYFCLGPSGAGKSTIASLWPRKKVLGDDMNVIKIEDGKCWAQAGALGQALVNPKEYSNWYPVKALLWLKKSPRLNLAPLDRSTQTKHLLTAVANVFWQNLSEEQSLMIFNYLTQVLNQNRMYELSFPIRGDVWDFVFRKLKEEL